MPKLIPQINYFGALSVINARINSPKHFFPACIGSVDDGMVSAELDLGCPDVHRIYEEPKFCLWTALSCLILATCR